MESSRDRPPLTWSFEWDWGRGEVAALGGMLGPVFFHLDDGRDVQPFAIAPWADEPDTPNDLPGILQRLRGEWPCVPFGMPEPPPELPSEWQSEPSASNGFHVDAHGPSANFEWHLKDHFGTGIEIEFHYPAHHPVERLVRRIEGRMGQAAVNIGLIVHMRQDARLPLGLHPVFQLPENAGSARLELPAISAMTYPVETEPGVSRLMTDQTSSKLQKMRAVTDADVDITSLPLVGCTEELVQVAVKDGHARLSLNDESYAIDLNWNVKQFPFCLLWISNRGRSQPPWNSRHCALGIEPVSSAFDLGIDVSNNEMNPLATLGETSRVLLRGTPFTTSYSVSVHNLAIQYLKQ